LGGAATKFPPDQVSALDPKGFFFGAPGGSCQVARSNTLHQLACGFKWDTREQPNGDAQPKFREQIQGFPLAQQAGVAKHGQSTLNAVVQKFSAGVQQGVSGTPFFTNHPREKVIF
jgi:hypothetical protein